MIAKVEQLLRGHREALAFRPDLKECPLCPSATVHYRTRFCEALGVEFYFAWCEAAEIQVHWASTPKPKHKDGLIMDISNADEMPRGAWEQRVRRDEQQGESARTDSGP